MQRTNSDVLTVQKFLKKLMEKIKRGWNLKKQSDVTSSILVFVRFTS